ncbi:MAG TPA: hypothetical protein VKE27_03825 [Candidatus Dormibacteraeota bacterium]|nr:hypothetical protein [Candidatus Dormibacteraeota bacterium]
MKRHISEPREAEIADLHTQYEGLLDTVWKCEKRARQQDRIDARARFEAQQRQRRSGK